MITKIYDQSWGLVHQIAKPSLEIYEGVVLNLAVNIGASRYDSLQNPWPLDEEELADIFRNHSKISNHKCLFLVYFNEVRRV